MAHAPEALVFVARSSIDVDTDAGEGTGEGFRGDADAIWKCSNLVQRGGILKGALKSQRERESLGGGKEQGRLHTLVVVSGTVAKLLDTERGARTSGFADSTARNAERRILVRKGD